jgi:hypothetical protein
VFALLRRHVCDVAHDGKTLAESKNFDAVAKVLKEEQKRIPSPRPCSTPTSAAWADSPAPRRLPLSY